MYSVLIYSPCPPPQIRFAFPAQCQVTVKILIFVLKADPSLLGHYQKAKVKATSNLSDAHTRQSFVLGVGNELSLSVSQSTAMG